MLNIMIILGIDPGIARTGYGVIETGGRDCVYIECGCIETRPGTPSEERLFILAQKLDRVFKKFSPGIVAMESIFFFKNLKTAVGTSQAQGVILFSAAKNRVSVVEYTPPQIKLAVTGYGRATKTQIQKILLRSFSLSSLPGPDDAADALATAYCHFWYQKFNNKIR